MENSEVNHSERKHAKLSASSSARWLTCTASVKAIDDATRTMRVVIKDSSPFAREGTAAHEVADLCLRNNKHADEYFDEVVEDVRVDWEMVENVQKYLNYVRHIGGHLLPEQRVDFSTYIPDGFGTSDAICVVEDEKTVHIFDLKYGRGVEVSAYENTQGMLYAVGVLNEYAYIFDIDHTWKFVIHIVQPRIGNYSDYEITVKALLDWAEWAKGQAEEALSENGVYAPSEKACKWCAMKPICRHRKEHIEDEMMIQFDNLDEEPPKDQHTLSMDELGLIFSYKAQLVEWLNSIEAYLQTQMESGEPVKGFKLVHKRAIRRWSEDAEEKLVEALGEQAYKKSIIGIGEAERLIGRQNLKDLDITEKPDAKVTIAPESDKRPALEPVADMFDNLD